MADLVLGNSKKIIKIKGLPVRPSFSGNLSHHVLVGQTETSSLSHQAEVSLFFDAVILGGDYLEGSEAGRTISSLILPVSTGSGSIQGFVARYDIDGTFRWAAPIICEDNVQCRSIVADRDGNIYAMMRVSSMATSSSVDVYPGDNSSGAYSGSLFCTVTNNSPVNPDQMAVVVKYDEDGNVLGVTGFATRSNSVPANDNDIFGALEFENDDYVHAVFQIGAADDTILQVLTNTSGGGSAATEADQLTLDTSPMTSSKTGIASARIDRSTHVYSATSLDYHHCNDTTSGSFFPNGTQTNGRGNSSRFFHHAYTSQSGADRDHTFHRRTANDTVTDRLINRNGAVVQFDGTTKAVRWCNAYSNTSIGIGSSQAGERPEASDMLENGDVVSAWRTRTGSGTALDFRLTATDGNSTISGISANEAALIRWNDAGELVWNKRIANSTGAASCAPEHILIDEDVGKIWVGFLVRRSSTQTFTFGPGESEETILSNLVTSGTTNEYILGKFDLATGDFEHLTRIRSSDGSIIIRRITMSQGEIYLAGEHGGTTTLGFDAGEAGHGPGTDIVLSPVGTEHGIFVIDASTGEGLRFDEVYGEAPSILDAVYGNQSA